MSSLIGGTPSNVHRLGAARTLVSNQGRQLEARCALFECQLGGWHTQLCAPGEVKKLGNAHALTVTYEMPVTLISKLPSAMLCLK